MPLVENDYWHSDGVVKCLSLPTRPHELLYQDPSVVPANWYAPTFDDSTWTTPVNTGGSAGQEWLPLIGGNAASRIPPVPGGVWPTVTAVEGYQNVLFRHWLTLPDATFLNINFGIFTQNYSRVWIDQSYAVVGTGDYLYIPYDVFINGYRHIGDAQDARRLIPNAPNLIAFYILQVSTHLTTQFGLNYNLTQYAPPAWHMWRIHTTAGPTARHYVVSPPPVGRAIVTPTMLLGSSSPTSAESPRGFSGPVEIANGTAWSGDSEFSQYDRIADPVTWSANLIRTFPPTVGTLSTARWTYGTTAGASKADTFAQGFVARWPTVPWVAVRMTASAQATPTWTATVTIYTEANGRPSVALGASTLTFPTALLPGPGAYHFVFSPAVSVTPETTYFAVLTFAGILTDSASILANGNVTLNALSWSANEVPSLALNQPAYGHDEVASQTLMSVGGSAYSSLSLYASTSLSVTPGATSCYGPYASGQVDLSDNAVHTVLTGGAAPASLSYVVFELTQGQSGSTSVFQHSTVQWTISWVRPGGATIFSTSASTTYGTTQRHVRFAPPLGGGLALAGFTITAQSTGGNLDPVSATCIAGYCGVTAAPSTDIHAVWDMQIGGGGLAVLGHTNGYTAWTSPPNGLGVGGRRDPNADGWPLVSILSGWNYQTFLSPSGNFTDAIQQPMGMFADSGNLWIIDEHDSSVSGHSVPTSWGPIKAYTDDTTPTAVWPWSGLSEPPVLASDNTHASRAVRLPGGRLIALLQSTPERIAGVGRARVGYQFLDGLTSGTFSRFRQFNTLDPVHYRVADILTDANGNAHLFWYAYHSQAPYTLPGGATAYLSVADRLYHVAIAPDGTEGPITTFDLVDGGSTWPTGKGCTHPAGGVIFPYLSTPQYGGPSTFRAVIWPNDITAAKPTGWQDLPVLPVPGSAAAASQVPVVPNMVHPNGGANPGPCTLVRAGAAIYLFAMDGLGISVAQSDGTLWSGLAQWFSNGTTANVPYMPDAHAIMQMDMSAAWIASQGKIGVVYTLGQLPADLFIFRSAPSYQPTTLFDWYTPLATYPPFVRSGATPSRASLAATPSRAQASSGLRSVARVIG